MKADYLSFKRATSVALLGLAIQLGLGLALLVFSQLARDAASLTASLYILLGAAIWLSLAVVYDQHRRERIEAMEAESLAAISARQSAVFEENAEDLRVAAKRLAWMHRVLLPGISLALAAVLIGVGLWRFKGGQTLASADSVSLIASHYRNWAIALGIGAAVAGFIFARFVSGMAKQRVWANLRAGAAAAVGAALMGLAIVVSQFVVYAGSDAVARYLPAILPVVMIVLGGEIVLNFLLDIYRPRVPGEIPRPAFDSRILGFVAAPDKIAESIGGAINYQFGFNVTGSWFYQLLARWLPTLGVLGVLVVWAMTFFAVVGPDERALKLNRGALAAELGPGLYLKAPWPFSRVERFKATTARRIDLASPPPPPDKAVLWTTEHGVEEKYVFVQPAAGVAADDEGAVSSNYRDLALVSVEVPVYYEVTDLEKFERFGAPEVREAKLKAIGQREVMEYMATIRVDEILGRGRRRVSADLRDRIERRFNELDAGVRVLFAGLEGVHPPLDTAHQFEEVVAVRQASLGLVAQARAERIAILTETVGSVASAELVLNLMDRLEKEPDPERRAEIEQQILEVCSEAGGKVSAMIRSAKADRWVKHMGQRGRAERYAGQLAFYRAAPEVYKAKLYFQTLKELMGKTRVYIVADGVPVQVRTNLEDSESSTNAILAGPEGFED